MKTAESNMSLAFHLPVLPADPAKPRHRGGVPDAIRCAARAALAGAKQLGRAVLVLGIFAVMLLTAVALGVLIWVPHSHVNW
jgi:hypothetical protein